MKLFIADDGSENIFVFVKDKTPLLFASFPRGIFGIDLVLLNAKLDDLTNDYKIEFVKEACRLLNFIEPTELKDIRLVQAENGIEYSPLFLLDDYGDMEQIVVLPENAYFNVKQCDDGAIEVLPENALDKELLSLAASFYMAMLKRH